MLGVFRNLFKSKVFQEMCDNKIIARYFQSCMALRQATKVKLAKHQKKKSKNGKTIGIHLVSFFFNGAAKYKLNIHIYCQLKN